MGAIVGQSLFCGFLGQIIFTILEVVIAFSTQGKSDAGTSAVMQMGLLIIPLASAFWGGFTARKSPVAGVGHPAAILAVVLLASALGIFNLLVLMVTAMAGYC